MEFWVFVFIIQNNIQFVFIKISNLKSYLRTHLLRSFIFLSSLFLFIFRIQTIEVEKEEAIRNAQDAQFNELKNKLEVAVQNAEIVDLRNKHLLTCKNEAEKQRDYYRKMYDGLQKRADKSLNPLKVTELKRTLDVAQERAALAERRLEEAKKELTQVEE